MVKVGKSATQAPHLEDDHSHTRFRRSQSRSRSPRCLDQRLGKRDPYAPMLLIKDNGDSGNEIEKAGMFFSRQLHEVWQHKIRDGKIYFNGTLDSNHHNHTKYIEKGTGCDQKKKHTLPPPFQIFLTVAKKNPVPRVSLLIDPETQSTEQLISHV